MRPNHLYRLCAATLVLLVAGCGRDPIDRGIKALRDNDLSKAETLFSQALQADPTDRSAFMNLCIIRLKTGRADDAMSGFLQVAGVEKVDPSPFEYVAYILMESNRWQEASETLAAAARLDPQSPSIRTAQAVVELNTIGAVAARTRLLAVVADHPRYAPALFNLAAVERDWMKNPVEGKRYFQRYLAVERNDAHVIIARVALAAHPAPRITTPVPVQPPPPPVHTRHAAVEPVKAKVEPPTPVTPPPAVTPNPKEAAEAFRRGVAHHQAGRSHEAIAEYKQAIQLDPSKAYSHYNLGLLLRETRELNAAETAFNAALEAAPGMTDARYMLALTLLDQNRVAEGVTQLNTLLKKVPDHADAHLALGMLYKKDPSKLSQARKELEQYLKLSPNGPSSREIRNWLKFQR